MMSKPLTFGELVIGDYFIGFPQDGDDSGHGGYRKGTYLFRKIGDYSNEMGYISYGSIRLLDNQISSATINMKVIKVIL